jgi:hypothetical protein
MAPKIHQALLPRLLTLAASVPPRLTGSILRYFVSTLMTTRATSNHRPLSALSSLPTMTLSHATRLCFSHPIPPHLSRPLNPRLRLRLRPHPHTCPHPHPHTCLLPQMRQHPRPKKHLPSRLPNHCRTRRLPTRPWTSHLQSSLQSRRCPVQHMCLLTSRQERRSRLRAHPQHDQEQRR